MMKLIFAQGNPGSEYAATRHNVGWVMLDAFANDRNATFQAKNKFKADIAELNIDGDKVLLVKPQTFYNETGLSARALIDFYKLDPVSDVLIVHDDLVLPFGVIRTREQGSDAGNNGIKSLNAHIGLTYKRIRIGIWNETRDQRNDVDFVLGKFTVEEREKLPDIMKKTHQIIDEFVRGQFVATTHILYLAPADHTDEV